MTDIVCEYVEVAEFNGLRGMRARKNIAAKTRILEVSLDRCLSAQKAAVMPELQPFKEHLSEIGMLALMVLVEKSKGDSEYRQHIAHFPEHLDNVLTWAPETLELLPPNCRVMANGMIDSTKAELESILEHASADFLKKYDITAATFSWAKQICWTRQMAKIVKEEGVNLLAPMVDMFNHSPDMPLGETTFVDEETNMLVVAAGRDYVEGEQVFISYGPVSNAKNLLFCGFLCEENRFDAVDMVLSATVTPARAAMLMAAEPRENEEEFVRESRFEFMQIPSETNDQFECRYGLTLKDPVPNGLLNMVRISVARLADLTPHEEVMERISQGRISIVNELIALMTLLKMIMDLQLTYGATLEEEKERLEAASGIEKSIRSVRVSDQQIIKSAIESLEQKIDALLEEVREEMRANPGSAPLERGTLESPEADLAVDRFLKLQDLPCNSHAVQRLCESLFSWFMSAGVLEEKFMVQAAECEISAIWKEKLGFWGRYLLCRYLECKSARLGELNSMLQETQGLRMQGCAVPSVEAIDRLKSLGDLWMVGDVAVESWAQLVSNQTFCTVRGGESPVFAPDGHALMLVWPDVDIYPNQTLADACLDLYTGDDLVIVGEWEKHCILYHPSLSKFGQSYSEDFQARVLREFELVETIPLPHFPLFADSMFIFKRKA